MKTPTAPSGRLMALDALRGIDMFWILGADALVHALSEVNGSAVARFFAGQLTHKDWAGFAFYDLIFPLFIFISGISATYSLGSALEKETARNELVRKVLRRGLILFILGMVYNNGLQIRPLADFRIMSVLGRIG
ncbi:MAG: heparan-alpha-glucosaminide N-acetyltransferase domain-containing protein, partial [Opitutaceae bacterium]